jgi:hypothetical protein
MPDMRQQSLTSLNCLIEKLIPSSATSNPLSLSRHESSSNFYNLYYRSNGVFALSPIIIFLSRRYNDTSFHSTYFSSSWGRVLSAPGRYCCLCRSRRPIPWRARGQNVYSISGQTVLVSCSWVWFGRSIYVPESNQLLVIPRRNGQIHHHPFPLWMIQQTEHND